MLLDGNDNDDDLGNDNVKRERKQTKLRAQTEIGPIRTSQCRL